MKFALYARVSTDKQERERTIESQVRALRQHAAERRLEVVNQIVNYRVIPDFDVVALGQFAGLGVGADVETDDRRV